MQSDVGQGTELWYNAEQLCKEPQQGILCRGVLEYASFGCFCGSQTHSEMEDDMGASEVMTIFFQLMSGLGIFFTGVGVLWFVSVYKEKKE